MVTRKKIKISAELQQLMEIDAFKVSWPETPLLKKLRYIAVIESVGASTRLAGSKLSDREVEKMLLRRILHTKAR